MTLTLCQSSIYLPQGLINSRTICLLQTTPSCRSSRCVYINLDQIDILCFSTFQSHSQCFKQDQERESTGSVRSPKVTNATLVCESNGNVRKAFNSSKSIEGPVTTSQSSRRDTPTVQKATSHGLSLIRKSLEFQNLSAFSTDIIMASWCKGTKKQYMSYLMRWEEYCKREHIAPHKGY